MGGDLNLKKSWHPNLLKNQRRVYEEEKAALDERKKIDALRKEREQERETEQLRKLQEASGGKIVTARVDWMYSGPSGDGQQVAEEKEAFLLGKRRIDPLLQAKESTASLQKGAAVGIDAISSNSNANTARDTHKKILQDPLLLIEKRKLDMQVQAAKTAKKNAEYEEKKAKEREKKERRHKHRHHHRDRSRSRDYDERDRRDRKSRRDDRDERDRHHRRSRSRSRSPYRKSYREDYRRRSRSRDRHVRREDRGRDRTPTRRSYDERRHSRSPADKNDRHRNRSPHHPYDGRRSSPGYDKPRNRSLNHEPPRRPRSPSEPKESVADKLAKMQADASSLEEQRNERVRLREAEDAAEQARQKKNMEGGRHLITGMRNQTTNMDLGDVMARGRGGLIRELD
ncbi:hypothetical protein BS50DRAFT_568862 [Corynespora cassiicola Philippines]|uniref:CBF1-interacting co-repressor CIR N-terminal domain-containing protein n=1 Tax=Corynespora cassiicola Philippines TaxID=1448308 RepID=A0A2T2P6F5_CORCC|nr:hypothetical protein BS50DRAFT_568862 [Corynespora cassiicola Philippines]